jgi:lipoprotein-releasing system ATP-binding protein
MIVEAKNIIKYFHDPIDIKVLDSISFELNKGEFASITGKSGCGKSTLLYILSTMDTDYNGELSLDGVSMQGKTEAQLAKVRNEKIGFVFQFHYLLNEFTALENVMLPALIDKKIDRKQLEIKAKELLDLVELGHRVNHKPLELSGGEKQRVAIARALVNEPNIILADEPTGNLDLETSETISKLFKKINEEKKQTIVIVTHSNELAELTKDKYKIEKGNLKKI